jgi:hypothetical protein
MYSPVQHASIFGSTYVKYFVEQPILTVGKDVWSRQDVVTMGITQTVACGNLSKIAKSLGVHSLKDMYDRTSPYSFTEYRAGVATLYVLFAAFADRGLDPSKWYRRSEKEALVTFERLKHRELEARARERKDEKKRSRAARYGKHKGEVKSFLAQASAGR